MHRRFVSRFGPAAVIAVCLALAGPALGQSAPSAEEAVRACGLAGGLAVHLGTTDGQFETGLAHTGKWIVHGLALTDADRDRARAAVQNAGLYGLASAETWAGRPSIPYAANLVNLMAADADALALSAEDEARLMQAIVPQGTLLLKRGGAWKTVIKPRPKEVDDWTHYNYGPAGNPVSKDLLAGPPTMLKWIAGFRTGGMAMNVHPGCRLGDGRIYYEDRTGDLEKKKIRMLVARDAFNGVQLWRKMAAYEKYSMLVAHHGKVFAAELARKEGPRYVAYDGRTGAEVKVYDQAAVPKTLAKINLGWVDFHEMPAETLLPDNRAHVALHVGDVFYWTSGNQVQAIDEASGKVLWTYKSERPLVFPAYDAATKRLFAAMAWDSGRWSRWPGLSCSGIVAIDAATGREAWRNTDLKGLAVGQLTVDGDRLAFFHGWSNLAYYGNAKEGTPRGTLGALRTSDGKVLWRVEDLHGAVADAIPSSFWPSVLLISGGRYQVLGSNGGAVFDRDSGKRLLNIYPSTVNNRCVRPSATERFLMTGFGAFFDREDRWIYQNINRGGCAIGAFPANGMTYVLKAGCHCFAMLRGDSGYSSEPVGPAVADSDRLKAGAKAEKPYARPTPPPADPGMNQQEGHRCTYQVRNFTVGNLGLREEWFNNDLPVLWETEPVPAGDLKIVAVVHEHRVEARRAGGAAAWSFTANARISARPVVIGGTVFAASHDGWLYALDAATGDIRWRFFAGHSDRRIMAHGQLEAASPALGLAAFEGAIVCSAGRHPELDGGIYLWGLDPTTGAIRWKQHVRRDMEWQPPLSAENAGRKSRYAGYKNLLVNYGLTVEEGQLKMVGDVYTTPVAIDPKTPTNGLEPVPERKR